MSRLGRTVVLAAFATAVVVVAMSVDATACDVDTDCFLLANPCLTNARCTGGTCAYDPVVCPGDVCNPGHCEIDVGCVQDHLCQSDNLVCNGIEYCLPVYVPFVGEIPTCQTTGPLSCEDGNACTIDSQCTEPFGCTHTALDCDDGNPCTIDTCHSDSGCVHDFIQGCCRISADCEAFTDKCTVGRMCHNTFCSPGTPRDCDDGDACTTDTCDSQTGCIHTPIAGCGTSSEGTCRSDADCVAHCATGRTCTGGTCTPGTPVVCDDGEPCTVDSCDPDAGCVTVDRTGFDALACVCERTAPSSCAGQTLPKSLTKKQTRGCKAVGLAAHASGRKRTKLLGKAVKQFLQATKQATKLAGHGVRADCGSALAARFDDDHKRAVTARGP